MHVPVEPVEFGPFCVDLATQRLLRDGIEVEVRPQALRALRTLIRHSGSYVDYDTMIREAWDGLTVSRHTVSVTLSEVKKVLDEYSRWIKCRAKMGYCLEVPSSEEIVREAMHFSARLTREGFEKALERYEAAVRVDANNPRIFEGMAACYLMLGTYGMRPARPMYASFLATHARAVELSGLTPELRSERAHGWHVFEGRLAEAEGDLLEVRRQRPHWGVGYVRLTMFYATTGRLEEALQAMAEAHRLDPLLTSLPSAETFVRLARRELDVAVCVGKQAIELHPYQPLDRALYAQALQETGKLDEACRQFEIARMMAPDLTWLQAVEGACLARMGRVKEAQTIYRKLQQLRITDYVDAYFMALLLYALGKPDEAFAELDRAFCENSATLFLLDVDSRMAPLRSDPQFARFRGRVYGTRAASASSSAD
jgi:tetratricopeptide (TPR) repeat protein